MKYARRRKGAASRAENYYSAALQFSKTPPIRNGYELYVLWEERLKISGGRGGFIMQQLMAQKAGKPNAANANAKAKKAGGGSDSDGDGGGESSAAQSSGQTGGINYKQLAAAVNAGVVKPPSSPRNREQNGGGNANGGDASAPQSAQAAKTGGAPNDRQAANFNAGQSGRADGYNSGQSNRGDGGGYNSGAKADSGYSASSKGDIVNLTA